jgi:hypothetical protein
MRNCLAAAFATMLAGCAPQYAWHKNVSQQEVNQDHYACLKEAQQRVSGASYNVYGGAAQNTVVTNQNLYNACMAARGYEWRERGAQPAVQVGNTCVGESAYVGQRINNRNTGKPGTLKELHGRSDRCKGPDIPILATVAYE